jgi:hypothetical protein
MESKREYVIRELNSLIENIKRNVNWDYVLDELSNLMGEIDKDEEDN